MTAISQGGPAKRVKVLTDADLKANGGAYTLLGQKPMRVYGVTDAETKAQGGQYAVEGNIAMPVYVVDAPDGAVEGTIAPVPVIGVEGVLAAGNVAIPVYVAGGSLGGGPPDTPGNFGVEVTGATRDDVRAFWDAVDGATGYILEYSTNGTDWTEIADTSDLEYTHTNPTLGQVTHYYRVRAENAAGESDNATATCAGLLLGLVAYWTLDEASGTRADSVGSNDLTDTNTVGSTTGILGNAALFVAANGEYLACADDAALRLGGGAFTIQAWSRMETTVNNNYSRIIRKANNGGPAEWELVYEIDQNKYLFAVYDAGNANIFLNESASGLSRNVRRQVLVTRSGASVSLYVNNGTAATGTLSGTPNPGSAANLQIGSLVDGDVDEAGLWVREISAAERAALYNGGAGLAYPFT